MKILEICTVEFSLTGIPIHIRNYYNELKIKNTVDIVASKFDQKILKTMSLKNGTQLFTISRNKNPLHYLYRLRKIIQLGQYDVIHIHGNSATMSLELFACYKCNSVVVVHTHNTEYKAKKLNIILRPYLLKHADLYFAASKDAGEKLYGNHRFLVINNGIEMKNFKFNSKYRNIIRKRYKIFRNQILLGNIGTFNFQKNQEFLLELASHLSKKYHFMVIGGGDSSRFIKKVNNLGLKDKFTIIPPTNNINQYYSAFDIFLFPSRWEGLGMVAVEAETSGLKCLVSNKIPKEVKISSKLYFLSLRDIEPWIKQIKMRDKEIYDRTPSLSSKFDIEICAKKLQKIYIRAVKQKNENI